MAHGAFGAMGGVQTSATDYAKWVAFLLSAWPPRDGADPGPVRRATVRELAQGANYPTARNRPPIPDLNACRMPTTYGMGFGVAIDCDLGTTLSHGGGYPGYGSFVLLLPEYGTGIFAFANRTYAGPALPVIAAAFALQKAGKLTPRTLAPSSALTAAYTAAGKIYASGSITGGGDVLAMNMLMDRDVEHWARQLDALKQAVGRCDTSAPIVATGGLAGTFTWQCDRGKVNGRLLLAPTKDPRIQTLALTRDGGA
jgi:CubicO group peptidase (beta-lactamase class C family)